MKKVFVLITILLLLPMIAGCNLRNTPGAAPWSYRNTGNYSTDDRDNLNNFRVDNNRTGNIDRNNYGQSIPKTGYSAGQGQPYGTGGR
jgi:hypothetical protein